MSALSSRSLGRVVVVLSCVLLGACVPTQEQALRNKYFSPAFRADLQPLDQSQHSAGRATHGTYRLGSSDVLSVAYPVSASRPDEVHASNMIQSDCVWLAHDSTRARGDRLRLNWEQVVHVWPSEPGEPGFFGEFTGMCTGTDPITRTLPVDTDGSTATATTGLESGATNVYITSSSEGLRVNTEVGGGERLVLACSTNSSTVGGVRRDCGAQLRMVKDVQLLSSFASSPGTNIDGVCGRPAIAHLGSVLTNGDQGFNLPMRDQRYVPSCALDASVMPSRDGFFGLRSAATWMHGRTDSSMSKSLISPQLMVVDGGRTITRTVRVTGALDALDMRWSVPVQRDANAQPRWEENFSPSIAVGAAILRAYDPLTSLPMATFQSQRLCLENAAGACGTLCRPYQATGSALEYLLDSTYCVDGANRPTQPDVSPSYNNQLLADRANSAQLNPQVWRLETKVRSSSPFISPSARLTFSLRAQLPQGLALRARDAAMDFGAAQSSGGLTHAMNDILNEGDVPLRIERAEIIGDGSAHSRPEAFAVLLAGAPVDVPAPIDFIAVGDAVRAEPGLGYELQPVFSARRAKHAMGLMRNPLTHVNFQLYDRPFRVINGMITTNSPSFDFKTAAERDYLRRHPDQLEKAAQGRILGFDAFPLLSLPAALATGRSLGMHVSFAPRDYGPASALLRVTASATAGAAQSRTIHVLLRGHGVQGAILQSMPPVIALPRVSGNNVLLQSGMAVVNIGQLAGAITAIRIDGKDRSRFGIIGAPALPLQMQPGDAMSLAIEAYPRPCRDPIVDAQAQLIIEGQGQIPRQIDLRLAKEACR